MKVKLTVEIDYESLDPDGHTATLSNIEWHLKRAVQHIEREGLISGELDVAGKVTKVKVEEK